METILATSVATVVEAGLGAWASVIAIGGGLVGFTRLATGGDVDEVVRLAAVGAVVATPFGFFAGVATIILELLS